MNEIVLPPDWQPFCAATRIPAAVRAGRTVYLSGHAGEGDGGAAPEGLERQVRNAFRNMEETLREAGAAWSDVVQLTSYHVGVRAQMEVVLAVAAELFSGPLPAWTAVGVAELFDEGALLDISAIAVIGETTSAP